MGGWGALIAGLLCIIVLVCVLASAIIAAAPAIAVAIVVIGILALVWCSKNPPKDKS